MRRSRASTTLFARSDVLSLHLKLSPETRGLVTPGLLALMKPSALLVNTARAGLIAPGALARALQAGRPGPGRDRRLRRRTGRRRRPTRRFVRRARDAPPRVCHLGDVRVVFHRGVRPGGCLRERSPVGVANPEALGLPPTGVAVGQAAVAGRTAARVASTSRPICATRSASVAKTASSRSRSHTSTTRRLPYRSPSKSRR